MLGWKSGRLAEFKTPMLIVPICEDRAIHDQPEIAKLIASAGAGGTKAGKKGESMCLAAPAGLAASMVMLQGMGKFDKLDAEALRAAAGRAIRFGVKHNLGSVLLAAPAEAEAGLPLEPMVKALLEGACLANHVFDRYLEKKEKKVLEAIDCWAGEQAPKLSSQWLQEVETVCSGTLLARDWISMPSNDKRPEAFSRQIAEAAQAVGLSVAIKDESDLTTEGFGGILTVGGGSDFPPRLVILEHRPAQAKKTVVLVGKGVTFDSGGINLKPSGSLETMKMDMSGAAAVAATLITAARLNADVHVVGLLPLAENMPSGRAARPGDIFRSYSGKTVEIGNTDAEGRLILIDALAYGIQQYQPDWIVDIATLTGACMIALGEKIAGVFSHDDQLADRIVAAGQKTHERCWRLPLPDDYKPLLDSEFADLHNISSSRYGGAITAALFLSEFVEKACWAHIDIAGPAYHKKAVDYCAAGGAGFGVRLFWELLQEVS